MNWTRTVLDGFAIAAYSNLFAGFVALYRPRLMFPCYLPAIIKAAKDPPTGVENRFYWLWICFGKLLPLLLYGAVSTVEGGINRSRMAGDPPDIFLTPRLAHVGLLEFYKAEEVINEGKACVSRALPALETLLHRDFGHAHQGD